MAIVELPLICFFGKNAHFKYVRKEWKPVSEVLGNKSKE